MRFESTNDTFKIEEGHQKEPTLNMGDELDSIVSIFMSAGHLTPFNPTWPELPELDLARKMLGMNVSTYSEPALNRKFLFLFEAMCEPKLSSASIDFHFAYSYKQKHKLDYN